MSIISKETWDKFTQEEKDKVRRDYQVAIETGNAKVIYELENLFGKENLKPQLTYMDVARELFGENLGNCHYTSVPCMGLKWSNKIQAIGRLLVIAIFLNKDWKPDWEKVQEGEEEIYGIGIDPPNNNEVQVFQVNPERISTEIVYFRTEELALQAIQILGEDTVRLALSSEW